MIAGPPWHLGGVADALAETLVAIDDALGAAQAAHGLDTWEERPLQCYVAGLRRWTEPVDQ